MAADCIVAETNQGGDLVAEILRQTWPELPVRLARISHQNSSFGQANQL
jgi:phage terminase large subunit-like protein